MKLKQLGILILLVCVTICLSLSSAQAQSMNKPDAKPAFDEHCIVTLVDSDAVEKGVKDHNSVYDYRLYYFKGADEKTAFDADPEKYIPALGGDSTVSLLDDGKFVVGKFEFRKKYKKHMYIFTSEEQVTTFKADKKKYAEAGIGIEGHDPVKLIAGEVVEGKKEFRSTFDGQAYSFESAENRDAFAAAPEKYTPFASGFSATSLVAGKYVKGKVEFVHKALGATMLFSSEEEVKAFKEITDTNKYFATGIGMQGACPVSFVLMGGYLGPGSKDFFVTYKGKRYFLLMAMSIKTFKANPEHYAGDAAQAAFKEALKNQQAGGGGGGAGAGGHGGGGEEEKK